MFVSSVFVRPLLIVSSSFFSSSLSSGWSILYMSACSFSFHVMRAYAKGGIRG